LLRFQAALTAKGIPKTGVRASPAPLFSEYLLLCGFPETVGKCVTSVKEKREFEDPSIGGFLAGIV
jgi:hypothetical protein